MTATPGFRNADTDRPFDSEPALGIVAGRFALHARLGRGRFGDIYAAIDTHLLEDGARTGRLALQIINRAVFEHRPFRDRFREGFTRIRAWSHPNLVELFELGRDGGTFFATMQLLEGASLRRILNDLSPATIDGDECMAVLCQVGRALSHAHARGMVHGDVRPGNVFVTEDYAIKLLDFPPIPISPAAVLAEDLAARTVPLAQVRDDVYGLAALAYELLTDRHPYGGSLLEEARQAGLTLAPVAGIRSRQWRVLERALSLDTDDPGVTIDDFLDEFGVTGTERLPISPDQPAFGDVARMPEPGPAEPLRYSTGRTSDPGSKRTVGAGFELPAGKQPRRNGWRAVILALLAAGLGAATYLNYAQWRDSLAEILWEWFPPEPAASPEINGTISVETEPTAAVVITDDSSDAADSVSATGEPGFGTESATGPVPGIGAEAGIPTAPVAGTADDEPPGNAAADPADPAEGNPAGTANTSPADASGAGAAGGAADAVAAATLPVAAEPSAAVTPDAAVVPAESVTPAAEPPTIGFADRVVRVSEGGTAARIAILRSGNAREPVTLEWWTTGDSAVRDDDYGDLGRRRETIASGETTLTVFIPIVADNLAEPLERFFVSLAPASGVTVAEDAARTEVVIVDDD